MTELEEARSGGQGQKGYAPLKAMVPKEYRDHSDDWRSGQDDVMDDFDMVNQGMREFLRGREGDHYRRVGATEKDLGGKVVRDQVQVWRA